MRRAATWTLLLALSALAHEHHDGLSEEQKAAPVDTILWLHILVQAAVWGILFPTGMVLGLSRSRWHVPLQVRQALSLSLPLAHTRLEECRLCLDCCWVCP